jgi:ribosomal-protein-alanine acetyltransferase
VPNSSIIIRRAEISDLKEIHQIEVECFPEDAFSQLQMREFIKDPDFIFLVAIMDGHIVGFTIGGLEDFRGKIVGHIYSIDVKPECRNRGVGSFLLESMENLLVEAGVKECYLEVRVDNTTARNLYFKREYRFFEFLSNYYGVGKDGIRLMKKLTAKTNLNTYNFNP